MLRATYIRKAWSRGYEVIMDPADVTTDAQGREVLDCGPVADIQEWMEGIVPGTYEFRDDRGDLVFTALVGQPPRFSAEEVMHGWSVMDAATGLHVPGAAFYDYEEDAARVAARLNAAVDVPAALAEVYEQRDPEMDP